MMNGIAVSLVGWALNGPLHYNDAPEGAFVDLRSPTSSPPKGLAGDLGAMFGVTPGAHLSWLLFLAIAAAIVVWFLIRRTRLGYEARAVGSSPGSAKAGGVSIGSTQLRLFLISGALAGLVGMQLILADRGYLPLNYVVGSRVHGDRRGLPGPEQPDRHHLRCDPVGRSCRAARWRCRSRARCRASSSSSCRGC